MRLDNSFGTVYTVAMTNYAHGHDAEQVAAEWLEHKGYKILALNWKRPRAEIGIVAQTRDGLVLFTEVKYRESSNQGSGLDYITPKKLNQMRFAAELWVTMHKYSGEYTLAALEVSGENYAVTDFLEDLM